MNYNAPIDIALAEIAKNKERLEKEQEYFKKVQEFQTVPQGRVISSSEKEDFLNHAPTHAELEAKAKKRHMDRLAMYEKEPSYQRTRRIK